MPKKKKSESISKASGFDDDSSLDDKFDQPVQRNAANARERARMRVLSKAFYKLKTIIPWVPPDTKLSKLDTLRLASNYINHLVSTLEGSCASDEKSGLTPYKLSWPFILQQRPNSKRMIELSDGTYLNEEMDENSEYLTMQ